MRRRVTTGMVHRRYQFGVRQFYAIVTTLGIPRLPDDRNRSSLANVGRRTDWRSCWLLKLGRTTVRPPCWVGFHHVTDSRQLTKSSLVSVAILEAKLSRSLQNAISIDSRAQHSSSTESFELWAKCILHLHEHKVAHVQSAGMQARTWSWSIKN